MGECPAKAEAVACHRVHATADKNELKRRAGQGQASLAAAVPTQRAAQAQGESAARLRPWVAQCEKSLQRTSTHAYVVEECSCLPVSLRPVLNCSGSEEDEQRPALSSAVVPLYRSDVLDLRRNISEEILVRHCRFFRELELNIRRSWHPFRFV